MSYVIVKAHFPGTDSKQREKIYECLEKDSWKKVHEGGNGAEPVWYAAFQSIASEPDFIKKAIHDFVACSKPYCNPNLELQWGPTLTTFQSLV